MLLSKVLRVKWPTLGGRLGLTMMGLKSQTLGLRRGAPFLKVGLGKLGARLQGGGGVSFMGLKENGQALAWLRGELTKLRWSSRGWRKGRHCRLRWASGLQGRFKERVNKHWRPSWRRIRRWSGLRGNACHPFTTPSLRTCRTTSTTMIGLRVARLRLCDAPSKLHHRRSFHQGLEPHVEFTIGGNAACLVDVGSPSTYTCSA